MSIGGNTWRNQEALGRATIARLSQFKSNIEQRSFLEEVCGTVLKSKSPKIFKNIFASNDYNDNCHGTQNFHGQPRIRMA